MAMQLAGHLNSPARTKPRTTSAGMHGRLSQRRGASCPTVLEKLSLLTVITRRTGARNCQGGHG